MRLYESHLAQFRLTSIFTSVLRLKHGILALHPFSSCRAVGHIIFGFPKLKGRDFSTAGTATGLRSP